MFESFLISLFSISLLLNPVQKPQEPATQQVQKQEILFHDVKEGDTVSTIAEKEYGSVDFWTVVWNDNAWIENPNFIEKDWRIRIRPDRPQKPEEISEELVKKYNLSRQIASTDFSGLKNIEPKPVAPKDNPEVKAEPSPTPGNAVSSVAGPLTEAQINFLGNCESHMNPVTNTGNGFYGAFQFTIGTWNSMKTGYERADLAPLEVQKDAVQRLVARSSIFGQFPACSQRMRGLGLL